MCQICTSPLVAEKFKQAALKGDISTMEALLGIDPSRKTKKKTTQSTNPSSRYIRTHFGSLLNYSSSSLYEDTDEDDEEYMGSDHPEIIEQDQSQPSWMDEDHTPSSDLEVMITVSELEHEQNEERRTEEELHEMHEEAFHAEYGSSHSHAPGSPNEYGGGGVAYGKGAFAAGSPNAYGAGH